jgi:hypothetical protein
MISWYPPALTPTPPPSSPFRFPDNSPYLNSPHGQLIPSKFAPWHFGRPIVISPYGQLAPWTTLPRDILSHGQLASWTTCTRIFLALDYFPYGHFAPEHFARWLIIGKLYNNKILVVHYFLNAFHLFTLLHCYTNWASLECLWNLLILEKLGSLSKIILIQDACKTFAQINQLFPLDQLSRVLAGPGILINTTSRLSHFDVSKSFSLIRPLITAHT